MEKNELIRIIENNNCDLERIKNLVGFLWVLHAFNTSSLKEYELREKYSTSQTLIDILFELIIVKEKESNENIDKIYRERKEGVNQWKTY